MIEKLKRRIVDRPGRTAARVSLKLLAQFLSQLACRHCVPLLTIISRLKLKQITAFYIIPMFRGHSFAQKGNKTEKNESERSRRNSFLRSTLIINFNLSFPRIERRSRMEQRSICLLDRKLLPYAEMLRCSS